MILVILGHASGPQLNLNGDLISLVSFASESLSSVRMGLMFFISGMFVDAGLKSVTSNYYVNKCKSILWPFFIWSLIYTVIKLIFMSRVNHQQEPLNLIVSVITGGGSTLWFLYDLFIFFLIIPLIRKVPFYIVIPFCIVMANISPIIPENSLFSGVHNDRIIKFFYYFPFFYLSDWFVSRNKNALKLSSNISTLILSTLCFLLLVYSTFNFKPNVSIVVILCLSLLSMPLFICLSSLFQSRLIVFISKNSIVFYVLHQLIIQFYAKFFFHLKYAYNNDFLFVLYLLLILFLCGSVVYLRRFRIVNLFFVLKK